MLRNFLFLIPTNIFSRTLGCLSEKKLPIHVLHSFIKAYCTYYKINMNEYEKKISEFKTFQEFFTRKLKKGVRKIDDTPHSVISPVDGTIAQCGKVEEGLLLQAKGIYYSLEDLIPEGTFSKNTFYMTIYLAPRDYHRIHVPIDGTILSYSYFSGSLWPVNNFGVSHISNLFCINERIFTLFDTVMGKVGLVKVGATVVGKISTKYSPLTTNSSFTNKTNKKLDTPRHFKKGQELGCFNIGSTVILLFENEKFIPYRVYNGKKIQLGQRIGTYDIDVKIN